MKIIIFIHGTCTGILYTHNFSLFSVALIIVELDVDPIVFQSQQIVLRHVYTSTNITHPDTYIMHAIPHICTSIASGPKSQCRMVVAFHTTTDLLPHFGDFFNDVANEFCSFNFDLQIWIEPTFDQCGLCCNCFWYQLKCHGRIRDTCT